jgi:hypothetical protein
MSQEKRLPANKPVDIGSGPYLAKVIGHLDPSFMGGLEVTLLREDGNIIGDPGQTYPVKYAPPFYGTTTFEYMGFNVDSYDDTQKSYGMWFVPPDIGVTVLVVFIDGRSDQGFWTNCIPSRFTNNMIPAIGASEAVAFAEGAVDKYDVKSMPVAEVNRRANDLTRSLDIDKVPKPVHPIADRYLEQGTLADDVRGAVKSTSRRGVPNTVSGISTPGPVDRTGKRDFIGKSQSKSPVPVPVSRLGGTQIVMDDGDIRYARKKKPSDGPPEYADLLAGEEPETPNIPKDEYMRLRTRTGHQILMHNSEDLIYISNSRGTAWIELTSDGKMDIYCEDSISVHTKQDINFRADRDINLEAGRDVNINAQTGSFHAEAGINYKLYANVGGFMTALGATNISSGLSNLFSSGLSTEIRSGGRTAITAGGDLGLKGASVLAEGGQIHLNGPAAPTAVPAIPVIPFRIIPGGYHKNPVVDPSKFPWKEERYQDPTPLESILKRIPMHEPWSLHEHLNPLAVKPDKTDRSA